MYLEGMNKMEILIGLSFLICVISIGVVICSAMEPTLARQLASILISRAEAVIISKKIYNESRKMELKLVEKENL
jgi:hypothetical protein